MNLQEGYRKQFQRDPANGTVRIDSVMIMTLTNLRRRAVRNILRDGTLLAGVQVSEIGMVAVRTLMLGALGERQLAAGALVQGIYRPSH